MLADLKLGFPGSPAEAAGQTAYGKVTRARDGASDTFELRFTSVPEIVAQLLDAALTGTSRP